MKPEDWTRLEKMMDDKLRIVLRAETADGRKTGHPNLAEITALLHDLQREGKA